MWLFKSSVADFTRDGASVSSSSTAALSMGCARTQCFNAGMKDSLLSSVCPSGVV